ncbi:MAG: sensor histidine kinase, partial [Chloroflexi bacterium]|nr:sensor histidine kinase [Chloroflexota bacterium]
LLAPLNWLQYERQRRTGMRELEILAAATGAIAATSLEHAMLTKNRASIQAIIDSVGQAVGTPTIYLINPEAEVAASPGGLHNGQQLDRNDADCQVCHRLPAAERPGGVVVVDEAGQAVFRTMTPIPNRPACYRCHAAEERLNGVFYMDFSMSGLNSRLAQNLRQAFLLSVLIIAICAIGLYVLLSWLFITPMERIADGMRRFSSGERGARLTVGARDEVGLLADVYNKMADTIQTQEAEAQQLYSELAAGDAVRRQLTGKLISAREEESRRLARRIHDVLGQLLTGLSIYLRLAEDSVPPELTTAQEHLAKANALVRETIDQGHALITQLRPTVLDDYGLVSALQEEVKRQLHPLGLVTELSADPGLEELPPGVTTAAYRIVQEALSNVIRHAHAQKVWIRLERQGDDLLAIVEDDGVGIPAEEGPATPLKGMGILGMQERAAVLDGEVQVTARVVGGVRVTARLPLDGSA